MAGSASPGSLGGQWLMWPQPESTENQTYLPLRMRNETWTRERKRKRRGRWRVGWYRVGSCRGRGRREKKGEREKRKKWGDGWCWLLVCWCVRLRASTNTLLLCFFLLDRLSFFLYLVFYCLLLRRILLPVQGRHQYQFYESMDSLVALRILVGLWMRPSYGTGTA